MKDVDRSQAFDSIPRWAGWLLGIVAILALFLIQSYGYFAEGKLEFSFLAILTMLGAAWYFRDLRRQRWFWLIFFCLCLLHAAFVWIVPLPEMGHGSAAKGAAVISLFDFGFVYGCVRVAERWSQGWPKAIEVACRCCGKDVDKKAVRCPDCGAWAPAPPSEWVVLIGLAPIFVFMIIIWVLVQTGVLHNQ